MERRMSGCGCDPPASSVIECLYNCERVGEDGKVGNKKIRSILETYHSCKHDM